MPVEPADQPLRLWKILPVLGVFATGISILACGWGDFLSLNALREQRATLIAWHAARPVATTLAYVGLYAGAVALSLPGAVWLTMLGGFLFGTVLGTAYAVLGATVGACAIFIIARYGLADFFRGKAGVALKRMERGFRTHALSYLLFLRLMPIFPFWLINLVPALLNVRLWIFFLGTVIGIIPGTFVYALAGNGLGHVLEQGESPDLDTIMTPQVLAPLVGLALLSLAPILYQRYRGRAPQHSAADQNEID